MAAKGSEGVAGGTAAEEAGLAGQYGELHINGGKKEAGVTDLVARFATLRDREERLAAIAADLGLMEEQRRSARVPPTHVEVAAYVLMLESATAALEGLPTCLAPLVD